MCSYSTLICGQSNKYSDKQVRLVFNQLISVYGSAKPAPKLSFDKLQSPAIYNADGTQETYYVPLRMMHYTKDNPYKQLKRTVLPDWAWAYPTYEFTLPKSKKEILAFIIDPSMQMADGNKENNIYQKEK